MCSHLTREAQPAAGKACQECDHLLYLPRHLPSWTITAGRGRARGKSKMSLNSPTSLDAPEMSSMQVMGECGRYYQCSPTDSSLHRGSGQPMILANKTEAVKFLRLAVIGHRGWFPTGSEGAVFSFGRRDPLAGPVVHSHRYNAAVILPGPRPRVLSLGWDCSPGPSPLQGSCPRTWRAGSWGTVSASQALEHPPSPPGVLTMHVQL